MERVFTELSPRRDEVAQLYSLGNEKKEIATKLFRSLATVSNTLQRVYEDLGVRNGRELSILYAERRSGVNLKHTVIASCLLAIVLIGMTHEVNFYRRSKAETELIAKTRKGRGEEPDLLFV